VRETNFEIRPHLVDQAPSRSHRVSNFRLFQNTNSVVSRSRDMSMHEIAKSCHFETFECLVSRVSSAVLLEHFQICFQLSKQSCRSGCTPFDWRDRSRNHDADPIRDDDLPCIDIGELQLKFRESASFHPSPWMNSCYETEKPCRDGFIRFRALISEKFANNFTDQDTKCNSVAEALLVKDFLKLASSLS